LLISIKIEISAPGRTVPRPAVGIISENIPNSYDPMSAKLVARSFNKWPFGGANHKTRYDARVDRIAEIRAMNLLAQQLTFEPIQTGSAARAGTELG
jgi:hypothetical protein